MHNPFSEDTANHYRHSVYSIIGSVFLCFSHYAVYFFEISNLSKNIEYGLVATVFLVVGALCASPLTRRAGPVGSMLWMGCFIICLIVSFGFERAIKNSIAISVGYFDGNIKLKQDMNDASRTSYKIGNGITVSLSNEWIKKTLNGTFEYFVLENKDEKIELRPVCFHNSDFVMTEVVKNITSDPDIIKGNVE